MDGVEYVDSSQKTQNTHTTYLDDGELDNGEDGDYIEPIQQVSEKTLAYLLTVLTLTIYSNRRGNSSLCLQQHHNPTNIITTLGLHNRPKVTQVSWIENQQ